MNKKKMPLFFIIWAIINIALALASTVLMIVGAITNSYIINPVYIIMVGIGSTGLFVTGLTAISEWKKNNKKEVK